MLIDQPMPFFGGGPQPPVKSQLIAQIKAEPNTSTLNLNGNIGNHGNNRSDENSGPKMTKVQLPLKKRQVCDASTNIPQNDSLSSNFAIDGQRMEIDNVTGDTENGKGTVLVTFGPDGQR